MPAFEIEVDGEKVLTVCTDGLNVLGITVSGVRSHEEFACLDVSGKGPIADENSPYRCWLPEFMLKSGQYVRVKFLESGQSSSEGKTMDELYPDEPTIEDMNFFSPTPEMFAALRAKPELRDKYTLGLTSSSGTRVNAETSPDEDSFMLSLLWTYSEPERTWASLSASSLGSMESGDRSNHFFQEKMTFGSFIELRIT